LLGFGLAVGGEIDAFLGIVAVELFGGDVE
jgi:hypothetical protein